MQRTIPNLFEESVKKFYNNPLMWQKSDGSYNSISYSEMKEFVYLFACGMLSLKLQKGDRVTLLSEGRNEWVMSELAVLYCGAVNVPVSVKIDELNDLKFRIAHSESKFVIVSQNHLEKIRKIKNDLPDLEKVIVLDNLTEKESDEITKDEILFRGKEFLKS